MKVSCPAATGPDSLKVNESGIMVGTCNDGIDNDCDGKVDASDPQCPGASLVDNCNKSGDVGKECTGAPDDVSDINITDGYYCDTNTSGKNRCCPTGTEWNNVTGSCEARESGCYRPSTCDYKPFLGNETNISNQKWWNYSYNPCIRVSQSEACVRDGFKFGNKYYSYKSVDSY